MYDGEIEITVGGDPGQAVADAADHVALALMSAGAAVDFPGRPRREAERARTLRGVRAVVRTAVGAQPGMLPGPRRAGFDLARRREGRGRRGAAAGAARCGGAPALRAAAGHHHHRGRHLVVLAVVPAGGGDGPLIRGQA